MRVRALALLGVLVWAGCAATNTSTLASRFIRPGQPSMDLGGPRPASRGSTPLVDATISGGLSRTSSASSLESFDPDLRSALTRLAIAPTVEHHLSVARAYRRQGIFDQAYDYLSRSLAVNGSEPMVYDERARLWRDWGHPAFGIADAYRAVYLAPQSAAYRNTLGILLYRIGRTGDAEDQFQQALTLEPNAWYALANMCHVSLAQGRTRDAIAQCRRATALRAQQPTAKTHRKRRP